MTLWREVSQFAVAATNNYATTMRTGFAGTATDDTMSVKRGVFNTFISMPRKNAKYCEEYLCSLSSCLSVRSHISETTPPNFTKFLEHVACGRGSVLLRQRCDMLCTSGFVDDVTFSHNGSYGVSCVYF